MSTKLVKAITIGAVALSVVTTAGSVTSFAAVKDNGDGTQTIDNKADTQASATQKGNVEVTGHIGTPDNTKPGTQIPEGDKRWMKVELPTKVVVWSEDYQNEANLGITSADYEIKNLSGRPVEVSLGGYNTGTNSAGQTLSGDGETGGIEEMHLQFTTPQNAKNTSLTNATQEVIKDKMNVATSGVKLIDLDSPSKDAKPVFGTSELDFTIKGKALKSTLTTAVEVKHELVLSFEVLDKDGHKVQP